VVTFGLIRESAAAAGFVVTDCSRSDWATALGANGAYDAALFGWSPASPAISVIADRLRSDSAATNLNRYASETVDALLDDLPGADAAERLALLAAIDAELWGDGYGVPLYQHPMVSAWNWRVEGVSAMPWSAGLLAGLWRWQPTAGSESASPSR
jgi:peptide/nickel transport system substrate-binding protein